MNQFFDRPDCRPESPRKSDRPLILNMLKNSSRSKTLVPWSSGVHYVKRLVRLINLCTTSTISMFCSAVQTSLPNNKSWQLKGWRMRVLTEAIAPELPPKLAGSRRFSQKMRPIDQKRIGYYRDENNPWWNGGFRVTKAMHRNLTKVLLMLIVYM